MDKKARNERFLNAVDHLFQEKLVINQTDLCQKVGIGVASYSRIKTGVRIVSDDTIRKMNDAFNGIFNLAYFRGDSDVLLANQPEPAKEPADVRYIDNESMLNALIAAKDETIYALQQQLAAKDELIQAKDDLIAGLRSQLAALRTQVDEKKISDYPFPMGVAEPEVKYERK
jgi:transcriptional regulator with XRE-family HTH domain